MAENILEKAGLKKKDKAVMWLIYKKSQNGGGVCLMRPMDILKELPYEYDYTLAELESILKGLELDDYLDVVKADNKGELVYCITLHNAGLNFARTEDYKKRSLKKKIIITVVFAVGTAIITFTARAILNAIFNGGI